MPLPARKTPRIVPPQKIKAWGNLPREEQMIDWSRRFAWTSLAAMTALMVAGSTTAIAQECKNRGQLDTLYCDENNDLDQRFRGLNHIRRPRRVCRTKCG
jgi:hypothetical protein